MDVFTGNFKDLPKSVLKSEERLLAYNDQGFPVGLVVREDAHANGIWHASVHLAAITDEIKLNGIKQRLIVLQQRALDKKINPGLWDYTFAGHMQIYEHEFEVPAAVLGSPKHMADSIINEGGEELKLAMDIGNVSYAGTGTFIQCIQPEFNGGTVYMNKEYTHMFTYRIPWKQVEQIFDNVENKKTDGEVQAVQLMEINKYFKKAAEDERKMLESWKKGQKYQNEFVPRYPNIDLIRGSL